MVPCYYHLFSPNLNDKYYGLRDSESTSLVSTSYDFLPRMSTWVFVSLLQLKEGTDTCLDKRSTDDVGHSSPPVGDREPSGVAQSVGLNLHCTFGKNLGRVVERLANWVLGTHSKGFGVSLNHIWWSWLGRTPEVSPQNRRHECTFHQTDKDCKDPYGILLHDWTHHWDTSPLLWSSYVIFLSWWKVNRPNTELFGSPLLVGVP